MELNTYQERALATDQVPAVAASEILVPLLGLAGEVGELLSEYKKHLRDGHAHQLFDSRVAEELGDILWYIAAVCSRFGLTLDQVATRNLEKCAGNWDRETFKGSVYGRFDAEFPEHERFERVFTIDFEEISEKKIAKVRASLGGVQMGQRLTDNAYEDDKYRFHDVFHLACVAGLGWSPVTRRNLGLKRRSDPKVDEVEDGGRAIVIEEGVTALVFSYAVEHNWLQEVTRVDHDLLKYVKKMTAHLEVAACSIAEWEQTILMAFQVWQQVAAVQGGAVEVSLDNRALRFIPADRQVTLNND